jgi:K+-transporting ATPase KdpF subunit
LRFGELSYSFNQAHLHLRLIFLLNPEIPAMKPTDKPALTPPFAEANLFSFIASLAAEARRQRSPLWLFLALCLNLAIAPAVLAASEGSLSRTTAYAIGLLGLVTLGLSVYLFVVIFQPERF